jgi:hypothetical protein
MDEAATARDIANQKIEPAVRAAEASFAAEFLTRAQEALHGGNLAPILRAEDLEPGLRYTSFRLASTFGGQREPVCTLFVGPGYEPRSPSYNGDQACDLVAPVFRQLAAEGREHCSCIDYSWGPTDHSSETRGSP